MPTWTRKLSKTAERRIQSRRKHPRALVTWPVTVISNKATYQGKAVNISRGGALIYLSEELEIGDNVRLAFEIPEYQDVIVAKGEILRTFPLKRGGEQEFSYGVALKFTEISEENLKFFTGNLAPEWRDDYLDTGPIEIAKQPNNYNKIKWFFAWTLVLILSITTGYFFLSSKQIRLKNDDLITEIYSRQLIIVEQMKSLENIFSSFEMLKSEIGEVRTEVSRLKNNLPEPGTLDNISLQLGNQNNQIERISEKIDNLEILNISDKEPDQHKQDEQYYVVKKGDNLHQISLKSGITIRELKEINKLDADNLITPGQKLMLK